MDIERTHIHSQHGINFSLAIIRLVWAERSRLLHMKYCPSAKASHAVADLAVEIFDRMQAKDRACVLKVFVSLPLTRTQADSLNQQRVTIAGVIGGLAAVAGKRINTFVGIGSGLAVRWATQEGLPTYHAGDVIVSVEGEVSGGIGPQHSVKSQIVPSAGEPA
ncbi:TPA: hypothetical protein SL686_000775 [Pseudomonas aeruginosa]|uniref:hypothetical protein n=1 Tax=Pseudomonas aeruginosa TaxID=287 RepID=UPI0004F2F53A|nr:hypothetical protein [Pseudomonas aeruginosa]MBG5151907.1 hypothetical protein [Pseudomonas aeruginosa]MCS7887906.1 hypothetical protein [Pseudomonas aeruginosa]QKZ57197.1 hypothetical protein HWN50_15080 [Pseudomonas aeruginosa]UKW05178.1 hypothetical protein MCN99_15960 [Pseudomonas aeruginosa]HBO5410045.1 hypothetical protein [Pseudomonas aeruginosa]